MEGRGSPSGDPSTRSQRTIANRFSTLERNFQWLREGLARYPTADAFAEDWLSEEFRSSERVAALERFYERMVNSINQIVDTVESELVSRGEMPDRRHAGGPGRAARLVGYEVIEPNVAADLKRYLERRNVLQKEYPDLGVAAGRDAYEDAEALLGLLPGLVTGLRDWARSAGFQV